jgi:hypothetical protein
MNLIDSRQDSLEGDQPVTRPLPTQHHNTNTTNTDRHPCLEWNSKPRSQFSFFFLVSWGGVRLSPLSRSATNWPIVPAPDDKLWWAWSSRWNENPQGKPKYSQKPCPSATLSTTNPMWPDLGSNLGLRGGKPKLWHGLRSQCSSGRRHLHASGHCDRPNSFSNHYLPIILLFNATHCQVFLYYCQTIAGMLMCLTRGWVCRLHLLLVLASTVILRSESCGTRDNNLLSQIRDLHFLSPPTTRRATVEVCDPASTRDPSEESLTAPYIG